MGTRRIAWPANNAYQVLLVDEFRRAGVEVIFLNQALGQSPEDDLQQQRCEDECRVRAGQDYRASSVAASAMRPVSGR